MVAGPELGSEAENKILARKALYGLKSSVQSSGPPIEDYGFTGLSTKLRLPGIIVTAINEDRRLQVSWIYSLLRQQCAMYLSQPEEINKEYSGIFKV